jgi:hypothetical protein
MNMEMFSVEIIFTRNMINRGKVIVEFFQEKVAVRKIKV